MSWWRAESNAVDAVDGNDGVLLLGAGFASGKVGQAFSFGGVGAHIEVPSSSSLQLTNELTMELWYKDTGSPTGDHFYGLIAKRAQYPRGANFGINFYLGTPSRLQVYFQDPMYPSYQISASPVPPAGVFHHLAATYAQIDPEHVEIKTYVDGQLVQSSVIAGNLGRTINTTPVTIGSDNPIEDFFVGLIDEPAIYRRALTAAEIRSIYDAGSAGKCYLNLPPIANNAYVKALENQMEFIPPYRILIWCSSPDNHPLTLTAVSPTSVHGGSATLGPSGVTFVPPRDYLGYDSFGYTVSDGHGGNTSGDVVVYIDPRSAAAATMLQPVPTTGRIQLSFLGYPNLSYQIQRAESLGGPWTPLGTATTDDNGVAAFADPSPPARCAYYRAALQ